MTRDSATISVIGTAAVALALMVLITGAIGWESALSIISAVVAIGFVIAVGVMVIPW